MGALKRLGDNFDEQLGRLMVLNSGRVRRVLASRSRNQRTDSEPPELVQGLILTLANIPRLHFRGCKELSRCLHYQ